MKKLIYLIFIIKIAFYTEGCVDSLPFPTKANDGFLTVEGTFHNLEDTQFVRLLRSTGYDSIPTFLSGAKISIFGNDNTNANYTEIRKGVYVLLPNTLKGEVGKSYYLEIKIGGNTYRSEPEKMPSPIKPDSISFDAYDKEILSSVSIKKKERTLKILINTPLRSDKTDVFLRWNIKETFDFISNCDPNGPSFTCYYSRQMPNVRVPLASSKNLSLAYLEGLNITEVSLIEFPIQFKSVHYWQVYQNSITEKAHDYWVKIDKVSNQVGGLFDTSPAYVQGNIYNIADKNEKVLGYFEVAATEKIARPLTIGLINRDYGSIRSKSESPCSDLYGPYNVSLCCYCPNYQISGWFNSPQKPHYWK
jgi:hypothetical protein